MCKKGENLSPGTKKKLSLTWSACISQIHKVICLNLVCRVLKVKRKLQNGVLSIKKGSAICRFLISCQWCCICFREDAHCNLVSLALYSALQRCMIHSFVCQLSLHYTVFQKLIMTVSIHNSSNSTSKHTLLWPLFCYTFSAISH